MLKEIYIGKIFYFLNIKIKEMAENSKIKTDKISKIIIDIYKLLCSDNTIKSVEKQINLYKSPTTFRNDIKKDIFKLFFVVEPFTNKAQFDKIKEAAKLINIPLEEKVWIPELKTWTKEPVPVGIGYYQALEHYSDIYSSIRGGERYQGLTGQPTKGKSRMGGQTLGNLDIYALLQYESTNILDELRTIRSDDHKNKRSMLNDIITTGETKMPEGKIGGGKTQDIFKSYMTAVGLQIN